MGKGKWLLIDQLFGRHAGFFPAIISTGVDGGGISETGKVDSDGAGIRAGEAGAIHDQRFTFCKSSLDFRLAFEDGFVAVVFREVDGTGNVSQGIKEAGPGVENECLARLLEREKLFKRDGCHLATAIHPGRLLELGLLLSWRLRGL